jgi:hypothetical protein
VSPSVQTLDSKQQSETLKRLRLAQLMVTVGIRVDDTFELPTVRAYQRFNLRLKNRSPINRSSSIEERQSGAVTATVLERQRHVGALPRQRSFELASDHVLVITVGADARLRWWSLIPDPRILRSESPGPNGQLSGEVIYQSSVDFTVNIPDDTEAVELRLYHPRWTGENFDLIPIEAIPLRN